MKIVIGALTRRLGRAAAPSAAAHPTGVQWLPAVPAHLHSLPAATYNGSAAKLLAARMLHASSAASAPNGAEAKPSLGGMPAADLKSTGSGAPGSAGDRDACVFVQSISTNVCGIFKHVCRVSRHQQYHDNACCVLSCLPTAGLDFRPAQRRRSWACVHALSQSMAAGSHVEHNVLARLTCCCMPSWCARKPVKSGMSHSHPFAAAAGRCSSQRAQHSGRGWWTPCEQRRAQLPTKALRPTTPPTSTRSASACCSAHSIESEREQHLAKNALTG
jgi:hypothetical protein